MLSFCNLRVYVDLAIWRDSVQPAHLRNLLESLLSTFTIYGPCRTIGVGRFRILGGQGLEYWGGGGEGGPNSQLAHDVILTSIRRNDVASASF